MHSLRRLVFPEGLLVLAALVATRVEALATVAGDLATTILAAGLLVGALLALRFHRGRVLLILILLGAADRVLAAVGPAPDTGGRVAFALVALLVPLNLAVIALLPERGALTTGGLVRLGVLALQALLAAAVVYQATDGTAAALEVALLPGVDARWTPVPQLGLAVAAAALLLFLLLWARDPSPLARGLVWSLVAVVASLGARGHEAEPTLWLGAAGLVITLAVIESSYALAYHDGLTGLPGRRAMGEALHGLGEHYAIAMVDVDHFKQCNDRWGHDVGDQVLKMVASKLELVGGGGRAFRYGGEEFAVLFGGLGADQAGPHLEALRAAVEASSFSVRRRPRPRRKPPKEKRRGGTRESVAVTISIGLAERAAGMTPEAVVQAADQALYRAKEGGRNRVEE